MANNPYEPTDGVSGNNPYGTSTGTKKIAAPVKSTKPLNSNSLPQQKPDGLPPILGLGQGLLKGFLTPWAASVGALDSVLKGVQTQKFEKNIWQAGAENVAKLWDPSALLGSEDLVTGETIAKERLGLENTKAYLPAAFAQNLPIVGGIARQQVAAGKADTQIPLGSGSFWAGLLIDVGADPLTFSGVGKGITQTIKGSAKAGQAAIKAGRLAGAGEISAKIAEKRLGTAVTPTNVYTGPDAAGLSGKLKTPARIENIKKTVTQSGGKAAEQLEKYDTALDKYVYKTVSIDGPRGLGQAAKDVIASAADASGRAIASTVVSARTMSFLEKYAKRDITKFGRNLKTNIVKDADSGLFRIMSGNKVLLGEATSEFEAKKLAGLLRKGLDKTAGLAPASTLQGARRLEAGADGATEEAIVLPASNGSEVTLEKFVPHASDDGTFAVYDGDNVAVFNSVDDANEWIDVYTSPARENIEPVVSGSAGKYQVNVGTEVTKFTSKKQAEAYAQAVRTGEIQTSRRVTTGGSPIIDSAPAEIKVADALKAPTKKEASILKSVLKGVDDIAKKTSGWRGEVSLDLVNLVQRTLGTQQAALDKFLLKVDASVLRDLKFFADSEISFAELESALRKSNNADRQAMWNLIQKLPVYTSKGPKKLEDLLAAAKGKFTQITKAGEGVDGTTLETQVLKFVDTQIVKRATDLQNNKVMPAFTPEGKYQALVGAIGEENAKRIKATGFLDEATDANRKKYDKVLESFKAQNNEVNYSGYDDLVKGLERGDDVSEKALQDIFNLLDPDGAIVNKVQQAAAEPASAFLRRAFTREGGVASIREAEKRLAMMRDPEMLAKHAGLAYEAEVADFIKVASSENKAAMEKLQTRQTQQASAESFSSYAASVQRDAAESLGRALFGDAKKSGSGGQLAFKADILSEEGSRIGLTTLDDYAALTGEAYADGSRAMLSRQLQQSTETKIIGSLLAKDTYRLGKAAEQAAEKGTQIVPKTAAERLDTLITKISAANDLATAQGWRFVRTKNRNDKTFQEAYASEMARAKGSKSTPNFSALSSKHTVYLPMGDILATIKANGGEAALLKAFFPPSKNVKTLKRDSMQWISLGDGARRVLEMDAAGEPFDLEEIAKRLTVRAEGQEKLPAKRAAEVEEAAREMADILTSPEVLAELKGVHLDNAASVVKDFTAKSEGLTEDLFNILDDAFVAMHATNDLSDVARADAVRTYFRKFVIASDIMRIEGGPIAEAMFRSTAMMFADGGKILPQGKIAKSLSGPDAEFFNLLRDEEYKLFREALTKMYRYENKPAAPIGREGMKTPKPEAQAATLKKLDEIESAYAAHMDELQILEAQGMEDLTTIKAWEKKQAKLQARLDKVRAEAWNNWVPTKHWTPEGWVPTENFDALKASREAQQAHNTYVAGRRGLEDRAIYLADSQPVIPPHRKMTAKEKAKFLEKFKKDTTNFQVDNAKSIVDDVARNVEDEINAGRLDMDELAPNEQMMRAAQESFARGIKESTELKVRRVIADYGTALPKTNREFNELFRPGLDPDTPVFKSDRNAAKVKMMAQRWSGPTGRKDTVQLLKHAENSTVSESSNYAEALDKMSRHYSKRPAEEMQEAWSIIRDGRTLPDDANGFVKAMVKDMEMFTSQIFKGHARSVLSQHGINGSVLSEMFERFGLKEDYGFMKPTDLIGKTPDELTQSLFDFLPFGSTPKKLSGTQAAIEWQQRADKFKASGMTPLLAFTRMMEAVQMVKMEKGIAENAVAQFGWKAHFKTAQEALDDGWVSIQAVGKQNIARFLPSADDGALFHPAIADQMGSVFREFNNMYDGKQLAPTLRKLMKIMGVLKFTQTTLMPRHHVTNAFGDSTTAMIAGVRNPKDWGDGFDLAGIFTAKNFEADWAKFGKDFEEKAYRLSSAFADEAGAKTGRIGMTSDELSFTFYENGKPVSKNFNKEAFADDLAARGGLVPGFVQADLQGFTGELALEGATQVQKEAFKNMFSKFVARPGRATMKGFSDFTAAYSNGIRGAHALKVARSRTWNSYDEMMNAVMDALNLYHPTVQSLASTERKWGRLLFTYYTWIRVANSALIDMAVNHTGSMLAIPKGMYNYALMEGFNPANPAEPFESKNALPDYVSYSVYGPNAMDEQGPRTYRPPFLPLDVLDFWQIYVDPSKPAFENITTTTKQAMRIVGKSTNILGAPIIAGLFGVDPGTGAPINVSTPAAAADEALSNLGFMSALTGMGLWTPYKYRNPDTTNPLTDADRRRLLENSFSGMRAVDIQRPVNIKKAESQYGSRVKQYNERIFEENVKKAQEFVDDRLSEGYSKDEIIKMLRDMGVN